MKNLIISTSIFVYVLFTALSNARFFKNLKKLLNISTENNTMEKVTQLQDILSSRFPGKVSVRYDAISDETKIGVKAITKTKDENQRAVEITELISINIQNYALLDTTMMLQIIMYILCVIIRRNVHKQDTENYVSFDLRTFADYLGLDSNDTKELRNLLRQVKKCLTLFAKNVSFSYISYDAKIQTISEVPQHAFRLIETFRPGNIIDISINKEISVILIGHQYTLLPAFAFDMNVDKNKATPAYSPEKVLMLWYYISYIIRADRNIRKQLVDSYLNDCEELKYERLTHTIVERLGMPCYIAKNQDNNLPLYLVSTKKSFISSVSDPWKELTEMINNSYSDKIHLNFEAIENCRHLFSSHKTNIYFRKWFINFAVQEIYATVLGDKSAKNAVAKKVKSVTKKYSDETDLF